MSEIGQELIQAVRKAAAENPNYVYQQPEGRGACMYVQDGRPGCLIGKAAWEMGLIGAMFEEAADNTSGIEGLMRYLGVRLDEDELFWLETAQNEQDTGNSWGMAVHYADLELRDLDLALA